jgi:hypothetical protein
MEYDAQSSHAMLMEKPIAVSNPQLFGTDAILQCLLEPGEQVDMKTQLIQFGGEKNKGAVSRVEMGIGKCEVNIDLSRADRRPTPEAADLGRFKTLATGRVAVEVTPAKPAPRRAGFTDGSDFGIERCGKPKCYRSRGRRVAARAGACRGHARRLAKLRSGNFVSSQEVDEAKDEGGGAEGRDSQATRTAADAGRDSRMLRRS